MGDRLDALLGLTGSDRCPAPEVEPAPPPPAQSAEPEAVRPPEPASSPTDRSSERVLLTVPIDAIEPSGLQPRERFDEDELAALAVSIQAVGVLQPLLVRRTAESGRFELIAGERRWRAARLAGLRAVPAVVRDVDDRSSLEQAVVENLHRSDLNALEEAAAFRQLMDEFGLTQEQVAAGVGKSRSAVANHLRLFHLPNGVQRLISEGVLTAGHARALLSFPDPEVQELVAERAVRDSLTVRQVEELVRTASKSPSRRRAALPGAAKPAPLLEIERLLGDRLDTRVEVSLQRDRGRVVVEFADMDDLDRIFRLLS